MPYLRGTRRHGSDRTLRALGDVSVRVAPIAEDETLEALSATRVARLLDGWRGAPFADKRAVARAVAALSRFIADFADEFSEIEINPLAVFDDSKGCAESQQLVWDRDARRRFGSFGRLVHRADRRELR